VLLHVCACWQHTAAAAAASHLCNAKEVCGPADIQLQHRQPLLLGHCRNGALIHLQSSVACCSVVVRGLLCIDNVTQISCNPAHSSLPIHACSATSTTKPQRQWCLTTMCNMVPVPGSAEAGTTSKQQKQRRSACAHTCMACRARPCCSSSAAYSRNSGLACSGGQSGKTTKFSTAAADRLIRR
jgi:hypothetical protein